MTPIEIDLKVKKLIKEYNNKANRLFREELLDIKDLKIKSVRVRKYGQNIYYYDLIPYYKGLAVYNQVQMETFYITPISQLEKRYIIAMYRVQIAHDLKINGLTFF